MSRSGSFSSRHDAPAGLKRWHENSLVLLLYAVLTTVMTYPAVLFLRTKVLGGPDDNFHFLWELWYVAHALFDLHKSPFFDPDVFVPFGFSLIRNQDLSPGTVLLFSPLTHFFGEIFTYNFLVLGSFVLTAFGTYLLARELWSNRLAAVLAGVIVGFCPYRFAHATGHLSIVSTEWIPFFFLYLERLISIRRGDGPAIDPFGTAGSAGEPLPNQEDQAGIAPASGKSASPGAIDGRVAQMIQQMAGFAPRAGEMPLANRSDATANRYDYFA